jgi:hypothetical protein
LVSHERRAAAKKESGDESPLSFFAVKPPIKNPLHFWAI